MTTTNGHNTTAAFEGEELLPDVQSQALLTLMELASDIERGTLTEAGYRSAQDAIATLQREDANAPTSFRHAVSMAQANPRPYLETLARAIEIAEPLQVDHWGSAPPVPREWLIDELLPAHRVSLLTGEGGAGKSRLILQLAAGIASGGDDRSWINSNSPTMLLGDAVPADGTDVVFASWEDEPDEFYRRLHQISGNPAPWVTPEKLNKLHLANLVGKGPIWAPIQGRHISTMAEITPTGERLRRLCERMGARLLIVDPLAAAYAADENARGLVRAFVSDWDAWAQAIRCAVLFLAHPPKSASTYAGSTDWQGAVRALWSLRPESSQETQRAPQSWMLDFIKGNYGPKPESLRLNWDTSNGGLRWQITDSEYAPTTPGYSVDR